MADVSSGIQVTEQSPNAGLKVLWIETANTADAADTYAITLADYGISKVLAVQSWKHTTDNSVIVTEANTTAVSAGVLTITVAAGTDNDKRVSMVVGFGNSGASLT